MNIDPNTITETSRLNYLLKMWVSNQKFFLEDKAGDHREELENVENQIAKIEARKKELAAAKRKQARKNKTQTTEERDAEILRKIAEAADKKKMLLSEQAEIQSEIRRREVKLKEHIAKYTSELELSLLKNQCTELQNQIRGINNGCPHPYMYDESQRYVVASGMNSIGIEQEYCHKCPLCKLQIYYEI